MLPAVHSVVQRLLYEHGRILPHDVDIAFDAPTRIWTERLIHPTLNFFLFAIQENADLRQTGFQSMRVNGQAQRRLPPRRIDLHYMVSAHTTDADDEYRLLWRALVTLMKFPELPTELLPDEIRQYELPLTMRAAQADDGARIPDLWNTLGADPRPAFSCVLTVPVDVELVISSPLVLTRTVRFGRSLDGTTEEEDTHIGGIVRAKDGTPVAGVRIAIVGSAAEPAVTNAEGEFTLLNVRTGPVEVRVIHEDGGEQTATLSVPSDSYEIVLT